MNPYILLMVWLVGVFLSYFLKRQGSYTSLLLSEHFLLTNALRTNWPSYVHTDRRTDAVIYRGRCAWKKTFKLGKSTNFLSIYLLLLCRLFRDAPTRQSPPRLKLKTMEEYLDTFLTFAAENMHYSSKQYNPVIRSIGHVFIRNLFRR